MTEQEWLACGDPQLLIKWLQRTNMRGQRDRKLRFFACACCRRIWHLLTIEQCREVVIKAELYADGAIAKEELQAAFAAAAPVVRAEQNSEVFRNRYGGTGGPAAAAYATGFVGVGAYGAADGAAVGAATGALVSGRSEAAEQEAQLVLLRCVFGPPRFRPVTASLPWLTPTVVGLARSIYDDNAFDRLPVLADSLEEAGCTDAEILTHCRAPQVHVRGCWVVDLLLGKE